jgi:serine/threonine protein phosphatase 1
MDNGRTLAIGDIHGCAAAFDTLLALVNPGPDDTLITLGDYVDRGPDSRTIIDRLLSLRDRVYLVTLRGNHEQMMLKARASAFDRSSWIEAGGDATLSSYGGDLSRVSPAHWDFIENQCIEAYETETHLFVHASAYPDMPLIEQPSYILLWGRFDTTPPHESGKVIVCGHTSQKDGIPKSYGHAICIDTWACGEGWLTGLDVGSGELYQARQSGETRRFSLHDREAMREARQRQVKELLSESADSAEPPL